MILCEQDGHEYPVQLSVMQAPPDGPESGKLAIQIWQTERDSVPFESKPPGARIPTKVCSGWSTYLDEAAVKRISEATEHCDLVLRLPE